MSSLERYFSTFRGHIIGIDQHFDSPFGRKRLLYADWTATGRAYRPIETRLQEEVLPFFANTHSETSYVGKKMTHAYEEAKQRIKQHVNAAKDDTLIFCGGGMTAAVTKLQRIMGLCLPEWAKNKITIHEADRPVVFVTHMEHHSNQISWLETIATVEIIRPAAGGNVDLDHLRELLKQYEKRRWKIAAVTACSNVSGIETPYHTIARIMHENDGLCFVDFASAAPYVEMDMHPKLAGTHLDAIYFSCHKFLGGPGTPGVLVVDKRLCRNRVPDMPGGGTLLYTNPWRDREYLEDIEAREDGGTPQILQAIKAAMCISLKEEMGIEKIRAGETQLTNQLMDGLAAIPNIKILAAENKNRLGIVSFVPENVHYNVIAQALNDRFGIQVRGGCSCAGTYGHFLLAIDAERSYAILDRLKTGDHYAKPGWVRISIHPTTTAAEIGRILTAVAATTIDSVSCHTWQPPKHTMSSS